MSLTCCPQSAANKANCTQQPAAGSQSCKSAHQKIKSKTCPRWIVWPYNARLQVPGAPKTESRGVGQQPKSADKHASKPAATSRPGAYHTRPPKAQQPPRQRLQHILGWLPLVPGGSTDTITAKPSLHRSRTDSSRTGPVLPQQTLSSNA